MVLKLGPKMLLVLSTERPKNNFSCANPQAFGLYLIGYLRIGSPSLQPRKSEGTRSVYLPLFSCKAFLRVKMVVFRLIPDMFLYYSGRKSSTEFQKVKITLYLGKKIYNVSHNIYL